MEEYEWDFDYFHANRDGLYRRHKNEFVAVKNLKFYHDANFIKILEQLRADSFDIAHAFIEFLRRWP